MAFTETELKGLEQSIPGFRFDGQELANVFKGQNGIITLIFYFAGIAMILYFLTGGFQLMISRGDPRAIEEGKSKLTNGIIGFIIILSAYWIVKIFGSIFGLEGISQTFF